MSNPFVFTTSVTNALLLQELNGQSVPAFPAKLANLVEGFLPTFVYDPDGVAAGNVYTDWPTMMLAVNALPGPKWIEIADLASSVPAGTWDVSDVTMSSDLTANPVLTFAQGAHLTFANAFFRVKGSIALQAGGTTPVVTVASGHTDVLIIEDLAELFGGAGAAFVEVAGGATFALYLLSSATLGDGTNTALTIDAGGTGFINAYQSSSIQVDALAGAVPAVLGQDSSVAYTNHQHTPATVQLVDLAGQVAYTPTTPGNYNPVPTEVAGALDTLAAPNVLQEANTAPLTGNVVNKNSTGTLTRVRSGWFQVSGVISGTDSTTEIVQITITMDGGVIGSALRVGTGSGSGWGGSITALIQAADTAAHHFGVTAQGLSSGTLTVGTDFAQVSVTELG